MAWRNLDIDQLIIGDPPTLDQDGRDGFTSPRGQHARRSGVLRNAESDTTSAPRWKFRRRASSKAATAPVRTAAAAREP
jgi:hypothetical protein